MNTTNVQTIFTTYTTNIATNLANNIPYILAIVAGLISLGVLIHYVGKWLDHDFNVTMNKANHAGARLRKTMRRLS